MQTVEDILYTCYEEGIKEEVMDIAGILCKKDKYKNKSMSEIYYDAYLEVTKSKKETRIWESALIRSTEYFIHTNELIIEFSNGARYKYKDFNRESYDTFVNAESKGKHFLTEIRKKYTGNENMEKL